MVTAFGCVSGACIVVTLCGRKSRCRLRDHGGALAILIPALIGSGYQCRRPRIGGYENG